MNPEDKSKIDELKKSLYSRNAPDVRVKRRLHFSNPEVVDIKTDWEHPEEKNEEVVLNNRYEDHSMSFFTKFFIGSITFFIIAVGIGALLVFKGENIISANNIDIVVSGPVTIAGGDPISFNVQVNNKNNVKLQTVDLSIDFPSGTVDPTNGSKEIKHINENMDDIAPGGIAQKTVKAILYGEENSKKEIVMTVSYHVAGSNAVFKKQKTYEILVSSSPLSLSVSSFKEVTAGQEFPFEVTLTSNSAEVTKNLILKASYPFGFTFTSADIDPLGNDDVWSIGDLPPKSKKVIRFKGKLDGQDEETRVFRFSVGTKSANVPNSIATEYVAATQDISIQKPFMTASVDFDAQSGTNDYVGSFNAPIKTTVTWFNNLQTAVSDAEIHVKLSGTSFDKVSVDPGAGYYKSADNEIVWNKLSTPNLGSIGAGESGSVTFNVTPRDFSTPLKSISNPNLTVGVSINGKRTSESNVPESLSASASRLVKISSKIAVSSNLVRSQSGIAPFENTGQMPPKAEQPTTYTVLWTIDNTSNTVSDAQVRAVLPQYVKWLGKFSPGGEDMVYNSQTGEVVWNAGNVDTYTMQTNHRRQVAFQIVFTPNVTQIGQSPVLLGDTSVKGLDDYTGVTLTNSKPSLTTNFSTDPGFRPGNETVVR